MYLELLRALKVNIAVFGLGHVGLSTPVLLAKNNEVVDVDISTDRVDALHARKSPMVDAELEIFLANKPLNLTATMDANAALEGADYTIIATPTNYNVATDEVHSSSVNVVIKLSITINRNATIIIESKNLVSFVKHAQEYLRVY